MSLRFTSILKRSMVLRLVCRLAIALIAAINPAYGSAQDTTGTPAVPDSGSFTWIKLPSGEWLAGSIESLRDDDFLFNSEELDEQEFDWDDIVELRSAKVHTVGLDVYGVATGTIVMKNGIVSITSDGKLINYPKSFVLSIIEGIPTEWNYWSLKGSIGFVARTGNTVQTDLNTYVLVRRETPRTRVDINYAENFGEVQDELTISNRNADLRFDWLVSSGFFVTPAQANLFSDRFQNVDFRLTVGAGLGYFVTRTGDVEWSVSMGGGYQKTDYRSVLPGEEETSSAAILNPGTTLSMDITKTVELDADYDLLIGLSSPRNLFHHTSIIFSLDVLGEMLDFTISLTWDHNSRPQPMEDGTVPKKNDFRTAFGIGVDI